MQAQQVKRFIAGAICPKCSALDKLKAWQEDGFQHRECVECGFTDRLSLQAPPASLANELATRVNSTTPDPRDEIQVVKLIN